MRPDLEGQAEQSAGGLAFGRDRTFFRLWIGGMIALVFAMVLVGGATRLTESGLSITEWNLVLGTLPPLSASAWSKEFTLYQQTSQYALLNEGMSLADFKTIYWWEWGHRQLGRFIGLAYLAGFLFLVLRRALNLRDGLILFGLGLLLGTQGLVGWIMVASGLKPGMIAVAPVKLTLHLTLACLFFSALILVLIRLGGLQRSTTTTGWQLGSIVLFLLVLAQIALGGLVAGFDAGLAYNTWPLMDGRFVPAGLLARDSFLVNAVENAKAIQFNHRMGAYTLTIVAACYAVLVWVRGVRYLKTFSLSLVALVIVQVALGILTLVNLVPIGYALTHQAFGLLLLGLVAWNVARLAIRQRTL